MASPENNKHKSYNHTGANMAEDGGFMSASNSTKATKVSMTALDYNKDT